MLKVQKYFILSCLISISFTQIFFSEYAEGSSNNKYLEIYNATNNVIDLSGYGYPSTANAPSVPGEYEYWNAFNEDATLSPGDVYVICHGSADALIQAECDETHTYLSNGDDGYCLVYGTENDYEILDCIGTWDADPGDGWDVAGVINGTKDHTLVRKPIVSSGNAGNWTVSAGTNEDDSEWLVYDQNTWDYLGFHDIDTSGNIYGCMDENACNYNPDATVDNGNCAEEDCLGECAGTAVIDDCGVCDGQNSSMDCDGVCDGNAVEDECGICGGDGTDCEGIGGIIFSEYAEGSSNNKYLEIYNGTGQAIDLSGYAFPNATNGADVEGTYDYWNTFDEGASINPGDVYVICHGSSDPFILDGCDQTHTYLSNGNDGFCLVSGDQNDFIILDCIGTWGENPGDGWDVAGVTNGTKNHTLVRKSIVLSGNLGNWDFSAGTNETNSEWIVYDQNTWDYLGYHEMDSSGNIYGCMDETACNYNPNATADNGTCAEEDCLGECGGSAVVDDCGICGGENNSMDCEGICGGSAFEDDCGDCVGGDTGDEPCEPEIVEILDIINNCDDSLGDSIQCDGQYDLSESSASQCPLYSQPITTTGIIVDYFDITPWNGPHSFTIQDEDGFQIDFIVWPTSSQYQDGFDITSTDLNILTQQPFGTYAVQITGELGAYCDDDQQLDIYSEWQMVVEYEEDINIIEEYNPDDFGCTNPDATNYNPDALFDDGSCNLPASEVTVSEIVNNCSFGTGEAICCDGEYNLSTGSALQCPLYEQAITTTGIIVDYFDITPFGGPHSFTIEGVDGQQVDFVVWPESSSYQDGFDITATPLNVLTQNFGTYEVQITGELGAYCDDDEQLDINSEWQVTVEYEEDIVINNYDQSQNVPPMAVAGDDIITNYNFVITLDGSESYDSDGSIDEYLWTQEAGTPVFFGDPESTIISFVTPSEFTVIVFSLQVTDDSGGTAIDYVSITVGNPGELDIVDVVNNCSFDTGETISCNGEYDLSTSSILECPLYEQSLTTRGVIVDYFDITPFGGPYSFTLEDEYENNIDFVVWPESSEYQNGFDIMLTDLSFLTQNLGTYEVEITGELGVYCDDDQQLDISSEWQITVEYESDIAILCNDNCAPIAIAGNDISADFGSTVTLDATSSFDLDESGSIVGYLWTQEEGLPVFFGDPESSIINFTAPLESTVMVFSLEVVDDLGAIGIDYITVSVPSPPAQNEAIFDIINNCTFDSTQSSCVDTVISCDGQYDLSESAASDCPLYGTNIQTAGIIIDYFDITPFGGPHSFTIEDIDGHQMDFVIWPESSEYQDGFDITTTDLNVLTQEPFGLYEVQVAGELGVYCDDDQQLDISSEWQLTVEYENDIVIIDDNGENCISDGDVNQDGITNVIDIVQTVNVILDDTIELTDDELCAMDMNGDGIVNVIDIVSLVNIILDN
tara:strand:+ start:3286 stop:7569 length:4284 start_codon:yes stop_codon:yes gene_type:complete